MSNQREEITVNSDIVAKASPDLQELKPRAIAGLTEKELIEKNVVGTLKEQPKQVQVTLYSKEDEIEDEESNEESEDEEDA